MLQRTAQSLGGATLTYDAASRLSKTIINGVETQLLYDGANPNTPSLVAEYNSTGTLLKRYVHSNGIDEPIVVYDGTFTVTTTTNKNWFYTDQLGSIVALANTTGTATANYTYSAEGKQGGSAATRFGYTGQQNLSGLGVQYYKARMYSADLGRFIQTDPIGMADDMNLYAYVGNNPVNGTDPSAKSVVCGSSSCNASYGSLSVPFPRADDGFPSNINNGLTNYHRYNEQVGANSYNSLLSLNSGLTNSPTPGFFPNSATIQGTINDATPEFFSVMAPVLDLMFNLNPVVSYQTWDNNSGAQVIVNVTLPGHPLYPGVVLRFVSGDMGNYTINNVGIGAGVLQSDQSSPQYVRDAISNVWQGQSQGIINNAQ